MDSSLAIAKFEKLDQDDLISISGGNKIAAIVDGVCAVYGTYALIGVLVPGVNVVGAGSVGAFCAGYKLASWLL